MDMILKLVEDNPWFGVVTAAIAFASAVAAATPTPAQGSLWSKIYSIIDWAALNIGKAKQK
jgi:hypothetical protein|tara:strand:+ start:1453 stop:1635 length:183 start_codon:yes stop_codon:yes gene_type:complete